MNFSTEIMYIPGVGPKRAELLNKELSIYSVEDLLTYFPYRHIDRSRFYTIREINDAMPYIQLRGKIVRKEKIGEGRHQRLVAMFGDGTGFIELVWFKGLRYVEDKYRLNQEYVVFGKPTRFGSKINIVHPEIDLETEGGSKNILGLQALYNTSEKMKSHFLNSAALRKIIYTVISSLTSSLPETLPESIIRQYNFVSRHEAIVNIHFPANVEDLERATQRLKFEELFYIQLNIFYQNRLREQKYKGFVFASIGDKFNGFYKNHLTFALTNAQKRVLREIRSDMATGKQMNRLLQGDVGSGKTIVAFMSMLMAVDNGFQACLMAPTEILANQHFQSVGEMGRSIGLNVKLLTGSTKKKDRELLHEQLENGQINILIGTHALIEDNVVFKNLGLVVIDEQHRFGVAQRAKLWVKNICPPHVLVMTATPIPRTLAMTVYGDLEVSVIDELPPGRKPIQTYHLFDNKRSALNGFIAKQVAAGHQIYIVYPLIQESENLDLKNLEDGYSLLKETFPLLHISMLHGKMKPADKEEEMRKFVAGETQILVATTVIEVGVNVPNASVMIIESAERFGLSQLHQLRGRVGRGADQSYCILMSSYKISNDTRKRLDVMVDTTDGFEIAEADLKMRGPGDLDGTQQSGLPFDLKIANLSHDGEVLNFARRVANDIITVDSTLDKSENQLLKRQLEHLCKRTINWGVIS
ncbi:MAG: ATP-dependent DNA helicase RecG [Sphingobacteriia bacterium]|jgi:ATP-dependent DNA helicase RecG|nr:ATP-dependent DNA helicase RecG [Sphingobacteriia bacterium]